MRERRERAGFIRPEWWNKRAKEGPIAHALKGGDWMARGRGRILSPEEVIHDFSSDQRGSISPILLATLSAAATLMLFLGVACGQAIGSPPETPTSPAATSTPIARLTETTTTAEAQKPIPTPEKRLTQEEAVAQVNQIISLIQNPDPALVTKYNLDPEGLAEDQSRLLCGGKGCSKLHFDPDNSLYGLLDLLQKGDLAGAKKMLNPQLLNGLNGSLVSKDGSSTDKINWVSSQINTYDPQRKYFFKDSVIAPHSAVKEQALINSLELYYSL